MKIVHSFWSKPSLSNRTDRVVGGWRELKYFYMSWALSSLTFKRIYENIELVTDNEGYILLIEKLKLPYSAVKVELDCLNHYPENLWAIGKIYSYRIQEEPFIHVDGDVYVWNKFGANIENAGLIAQHLDLDYEGHYTEALRQIRNNDFLLPNVMENDLVKYDKIESSNAGIIGGKDMEFIKMYCKKAFDLIHKNSISNNSNYNGTSYALLYEQYLYSCLARKAKKEITFYLDQSSLKESFNVSDFQNKYNDSYKYVHLSGGNKTSLKHCYELENQLRLEFPKYHDRILGLIHDKKILN